MRLSPVSNTQQAAYKSSLLYDGIFCLECLFIYVTLVINPFLLHDVMYKHDVFA
jgi:hypothetical protein